MTGTCGKDESSVGRWCFRHRVELASLCGGAGFLFYLWMPESSLVLLARAAGVPTGPFVRGGYLLLALLNILASVLRIWAGGTLGGARMMALKTQTTALITSGPYGHVRNPIYLADNLTLAGMGFVVPWPGTLLVWLLLPVIYGSVISHEERQLGEAFKTAYTAYRHNVPRLGWRFSAWRSTGAPVRFRPAEGVVNNFLYLPLIPGFLVSAATGNLWHGVLVGAAGPVGWVILHFWRNFRQGGLARRRA